MGDDTYLKQPKFMSITTIKYFAQKLKKYCEHTKLKHVYIAFHGGEPLLTNKKFYIDSTQYINTIMEGVEVTYMMQTNGTLLNDEWCDLLKQLNIQVGISIDGPKEFHNEFRIYHNNNGSFEDVTRGIKLRNKYGVGGVISVINIDIPPIKFYEFYKSLESPIINILLPDGHFDNFPEGFRIFNNINATPYGDWLIELYNYWKNDRENSKPNITFLQNIVSIILGVEKGDELIGKRKNGAICIESDGAIEVVDPLRICGNGFTRNNLNVKTSELDDITELPLFDLFYNSHTVLSSKCEVCAIKDICGSGYLAHRYSKHNGFNNPTIYCKDLMKLITYIQNDIINDLPAEIVKELEIEALSYEEALSIIEPYNNSNNLNSDFLEFFKESVSLV